MQKTINVAVTGAAGRLSYSLIPMICNGEMFGKETKMELRLLEIPSALKFLDGFVMELHDSAYPLVTKIIPTSDPKIAFKDVDYCIFVGSCPRRKGMDRADLLEKNGQIFKSQGKFLEKYAKKTCKSLVVGNPCNTNCYLLAQYAPKIPKKNFTSLSRLDHNRATGQIKQKVGEHVKNMIIFGNHSKTQIPYAGESFFTDPLDGKKIMLKHYLIDKDEEIRNWMNEKFSDIVKTRGGEVIKTRGVSSATSAARATCDHMFNWIHGTKEDEWVSMGVYLEKEVYGIKDYDIVYSLPCSCANGDWKIVDNLELDEKHKKLIKLSAEELVDEREKAKRSILSPRKPKSINQ